MNSSALHRVPLGAQAPVEAGLYPVAILRAGQANGLRFPPAVLRAAAPLFEGVPVFVDHPGLLDTGRAGGRSVRDLAGSLHGVHWEDASQELRAGLRLLPAAGWIVGLIEGCGRAPFFGLSADVWVRRAAGEVTAIERVHSVDIVVHPAAGGRFLSGRPALAADCEHRQEETIVNSETVSTQPEAAVRLRAADEASTPSAAPEEGAASPGTPQVAELARQLLDLKLAEAGLPPVLSDAVRAQFQSGVVGWDGLDALIGDYRARWGEATAQAAIRNLGQPLSVSAPLDRLRLALERLMGLPETAEHRAAPRLTGIRELYDTLTGDWERRGVFHGERVALANATTATLPALVADVLNKVLLREYELRPQWWKPIAFEDDFPSLQDVRWISAGGFADLDTVAEGDPYTEVTWADAVETSAFVKKGNYLGLTLEMLDRDDVGAVRAIPRRLAHAAQRTLSAAVATLFTASSGIGPELADGYHLFDAGHHANLGSDALGATAWWAAVRAMFVQPELGSAKRLGVRPRYCLVPVELEKTALEVFTSDYPPGATTFEQNVLRNSANVVTVPEWTDASDWAAAAEPSELEGVCIGYRFGRAPEIYLADGDLMGAMFTNDELRVKVRFVFSVGVGNYRALFKSNVSD